jgi:hypothetical protein
MITSNSFTSAIKEVTLISNSALTVSQANSYGNVLDMLSQQDKTNIFSNTNYPISQNAVKLLSPITNNNGKIKVYTKINSNFNVGDRIFFMYDPNAGDVGTDSVIIDNYLEFSGCTNFKYLEQMQGYDIIEIDESNNEITIDRYYDTRFENKKLYNHYISKIYIRNIVINGGEIDGACILNGSFNTTSDVLLDINLIQAVVLSGTSYYMRYKDKYDNLYIGTNSAVDTGTTSSIYKPYSYKGVDTQNQDMTPISSYYSNNNELYGYTYVYNNNLTNCRIDNGYYINCNLTDCLVNGGSFTNCNISASTINDGYFTDTILTSDCYWFGGTWNGGNFSMDIWYGGTWNAGDFCGKQWRDGVFNGGYFSGSTWKNGIFQGGSMENSTWSGGTFSYGIMNFTDWNDGTFNSGQMSNGNWSQGICNGGTIIGVEWLDGVFNGGSFTNGIWNSGIFNDGSIINTLWITGTFNGGTFNSGNNVQLIENGTIFKITDAIYNSGRCWMDGIFNGGIFSNSIWNDGTFVSGSFQNGSVWLGGGFKDGHFDNSSWINGDFLNGTVFKSNFHNVNWYDGIWNNGLLGVSLDIDGTGVEDPNVIWYKGTFNNGTFGYESSKTIAWIGGDFYGGTFINYSPNCQDISQPYPQELLDYGGFFGGSFHNGVFQGTFYKGTWVSGTFKGCNRSGMILDTINKDTVVFKTATGGLRKYGEQNIKTRQNGLRNTN